MSSFGGGACEPTQCCNKRAQKWPRGRKHASTTSAHRKTHPDRRSARSHGLLAWRRAQEPQSRDQSRSTHVKSDCSAKQRRGRPAPSLAGKRAARQDRPARYERGADGPTCGLRATATRGGRHIGQVLLCSARLPCPMAEGKRGLTSRGRGSGGQGEGAVWGEPRTRPWRLTLGFPPTGSLCPANERPDR